MLLDRHRAESVAKYLGLGSVTLLYRWKTKLRQQTCATAQNLENRVRQLEEDLRPVERERDILKCIGHLQPADVTEIYTVIDQLEEAYPVNILSNVLQVSRSAYYAWRQEDLSENATNTACGLWSAPPSTTTAAALARGGSWPNWRPGTRKRVPARTTADASAG